MPIACLWLDQTVTDGVADEAGCVMDVELFHDVCPVGLGRLDTDLKNLGNFFGAFTLGHEL